MKNKIIKYLNNISKYLKKNLKPISIFLVIVIIVIAGILIRNRNNIFSSKKITDSQQSTQASNNEKSDSENAQDQKTETQTNKGSGGSNQIGNSQEQKSNPGSINTESSSSSSNNPTPEAYISSWGMDYGNIDDCGNGVCVLGESYIITQTFTVPVSSCTGQAVYGYDGYAPDFGRVYPVSVSKINSNTCRLVFSGPDKRGMCIMYLYVSTGVNTPVKTQEFTWQKIWNNI